MEEKLKEHALRAKHFLLGGLLLIRLCGGGLRHDSPLLLVASSERQRDGEARGRMTFYLGAEVGLPRREITRSKTATCRFAASGGKRFNP